MPLQMSVLINQQQEQIDVIEENTAGVSKDAEAGYVCSKTWNRLILGSFLRVARLGQVETAVKHARAARRKRWICFWLTLLLIAIVAIVVAVVVTQNNNKK
jgi:syntaxin 1B/2/3